MVQKARIFAEKAHEGQLYGEDESYMVHLDAVASLVDTGTEKVIAYLHDTVEDTSVSLDIIEAYFGPFIAECISILSDEQYKSRKDRKEVSHLKLSKVQSTHYTALVVKTADRLANLEACVKKEDKRRLKMYRQEHFDFMSSAYRSGLCDHLWDRIEKIIFSGD